QSRLSVLALLAILPSVSLPLAQNRQEARDPLYPEWRTNTSRRAIDLDHLDSPGMTKDGIPSIDRPRFVTPKAARAWLADREPVITLEINGVARAYPMQILLWHEVINDVIGGLPTVITFCTVCHSA